MPHAVLLSGPRGIGKATLAFRFARFVLAQRRDRRIERRAADGRRWAGRAARVRRISPGRLRRPCRSADGRARLRPAPPPAAQRDRRRRHARDRRLPAADAGRGRLARRHCRRRRRDEPQRRQRAAEDPRGAAAPRAAAAGGAQPGRLLPTIRSRCRRFPLAPLPPSIVSRLLETLPARSAERRMPPLWSRLAEGSIGRALDLAEAGGVELYERSWHCCRASRASIPPRCMRLADRLARAEADDAYRAVEELLSHVLGEIAVGAAGGSSGRATRPGIGARCCAASARGRRPRAGPSCASRSRRSLPAADALNLDRKQTILGAFFAIERTAR